MSPASVSNFVGDLVAMATAFERLPQVEADLAEARNTINAHLNTIQRLEHKLLDRANEITDAQSRIRSLEVERDDAQFHALEADDRTQRALEFIKATFGNAGALIQALEPPATPKPEQATSDVPVSAVPAAAEVMPINSPEPEAQRPLTDPVPSLEGTPMPQPSPAPEVAASSGESSTGASADIPNPHAMEAPSTAPTTEPSPAPDASKPYAGKKYSEVNKAARDRGDFGWWETQDGWLSGGGTIDNYYA